MRQVQDFRVIQGVNVRENAIPLYYYTFHKLQRYCVCVIIKWREIFSKEKDFSSQLNRRYKYKRRNNKGNKYKTIRK